MVDRQRDGEEEDAEILPPQQRTPDLSESIFMPPQVGTPISGDNEDPWAVSTTPLPGGGGRQPAEQGTTVPIGAGQPLASPGWTVGTDGQGGGPNGRSSAVAVAGTQRDGTLLGLKPSHPPTQQALLGVLTRVSLVAPMLIGLLGVTTFVVRRWPLVAIVLAVLTIMTLLTLWAQITKAGPDINVTRVMRWRARARAFWRARVALILCPYCFQRLRIGDCALVRTVQKEEGTTMQLQVASVRLPAAEWLVHRLWRGLWAPRLTGERAVLSGLRWACPHCGNALPHDIERLEHRNIGIVGQSGSSKSHYIAALIKWLTEGGNQRAAGLRAAGIGRPAALDEVIGERYLQEYHKRLFVDYTAITPTQPTVGRAEGGTGNLPLIYGMVCSRKRRWKRLVWVDMRAVNLALYDAPGEQLRRTNELLAHHLYVLNSAGLIYLVDPLGLPRQDRVIHLVAEARDEEWRNKHAPGSSTQATAPTNPSLEVESESLAAGLPIEGVSSAKPQSPITLLQSIAGLLRKYTDTDREDELATAIAVTLAKVDLLDYDADLPRVPEPHYDAGYDPESEDRREYEVWVKDVLKRTEAGALITEAEGFKHHYFTGVTATGKASKRRASLDENGNPEVHPDGSPVWIQYYDPEIEPRRVLEPVMWLLWKLEYIGRPEW